MLEIINDKIKRNHVVLCNGGMKVNSYIPDYSSIHVLIEITKEEFEHLLSSEFRKRYNNTRHGQIGEVLIIGKSTSANSFNLANVVFPIKQNPKVVYQEFCTYDRTGFSKTIVTMNEDSLSSFRDSIKYLKTPEYVMAVKLDNKLNYETLFNSSSLLSL